MGSKAVGIDAFLLGFMGIAKGRKSWSLTGWMGMFYFARML